MKTFITLLFLIFSFNSFSQNTDCRAFEPGCWTLISAMNGVEVYMTHVNYKHPNPKNGNTYSIILYSKVVNTNDYVMVGNPSELGAYMFNTTTKKTEFKTMIFPTPATLQPKQVVVNTLNFVSGSTFVQYDQIKSIWYVKKIATAEEK